MRVFAVMSVSVLVLALGGVAAAAEAPVAAAQSDQTVCPQMSVDEFLESLDGSVKAVPKVFGCGACVIAGTTDTLWGMGTDCQAAMNDLISNLNANGRSKCAAQSELPCGSVTNIVIVTTCIWYQGQYRIDGYGDYSCRECD